MTKQVLFIQGGARPSTTNGTASSSTASRAGLVLITTFAILECPMRLIPTTSLGSQPSGGNMPILKTAPSWLAIRSAGRF
jgi:hypothetical protein